MHILELKKPFELDGVTYDAVTLQLPESISKQQKSALVKFKSFIEHADRKAQFAMAEKAGVLADIASRETTTKEVVTQDDGDKVTAEVAQMMVMYPLSDKNFIFELYESFCELRKLVKPIIKYDGENLTDLAFDGIDFNDLLNIAATFSVVFIKS